MKRHPDNSVADYKVKRLKRCSQSA